MASFDEPVLAAPEASLCETLQLYAIPTDVWLCDKLLVLDNLDMLMHGSSDSEYSLSFAYRLKRTTAVCIGCEHCCSSVVASSVVGSYLLLSVEATTTRHLGAKLIEDLRV